MSTDPQAPKRSNLKALRETGRFILLSLLLGAAISGMLIPALDYFSHRNDIDRPNSWLSHQWLSSIWNTLERGEYWLYDARFSLRGEIRPKSWDKIAIIAVDQRSLSSVSNISQWPWPRSWHARLVRRLKKAGARVIVLDFDFSDKQNPGPHGELSASDAALVAAVRDAGNVALPSYSDVQNQDLNQVDTSTQYFVSPFGADEQRGIDGLDEQTPDLALATFSQDSDKGARTYLWDSDIQGNNIGSLATLAAAMYQNLLDGEENKRYTTALSSAMWPDSGGHLHPVPFSKTQTDDQTSTKTRARRSLLLNFFGGAQTITTYSYSDVVNVDRNNEISDSEMRRRFQGRIVFVGATAYFLKDVFPSPAFPRRDDEGNEDVTYELSGVERHAFATAMLLDGNYLSAISENTTQWLIVAMTLFAGLWTVALRTGVNESAQRAEVWWSRHKLPGRVYGLVWIAIYLVLGSFPIFLFWQMSVWLFVNRNLWVIFVYPATGALLNSGLLLVLLFSAEAAERQKALFHFSRKVSPDVMHDILSQQFDYAQPRRMPATILFTDLEGFTPYSEAHEPEQVVDALKQYLDRMEPIIHAHGGNIDKYIGDAIMAFFGAPLPRPDHAAQALRCAVEMQKECVRFREATGIPFYTRIGVHTGDVIVGDTGSKARSDYSVIGDTVNLASRLEGKNKEFGSWVMCSAETYDAAPGVVIAESTSAQIKGKSRNVEVYIVRGLTEEGPCDRSWGRQAENDESSQITVLSEGVILK